MTTTTRQRSNTADRDQATRAWAADAKSWHGAQGGWIYTQAGRPVVQGWGSVWSAHRTEILDWITRRATAFDSFAEMLNTAPSYRPTIRRRTWRERVLADEYDFAQAVRGDARRAWPPVSNERSTS